MKPYRVLAAIDLSPASAPVLRTALEIARQHVPAEVHFVTVQELGVELLAGPTDKLESPADPLRGAATSAVNEFRRAHPEAELGSVTLHALVGVPANEIVTLAAQLDADQIVVGTHGRRGVRRAVLGSVAEKVVRTAGCPVLVVRPKNHPDALKVPEIEPPCAACVAARASSGGKSLWCERHAERHVHTHLPGYQQLGQGATTPWGFSD